MGNPHILVGRGVWKGIYWEKDWFLNLKKHDDSMSCFFIYCHLAVLYLQEQHGFGSIGQNSGFANGIIFMGFFQWISFLIMMASCLI